MPIPPEPILRASRRWLAHLNVSGVARTRAILTGAPDYADITPTQYADALAWLKSCHLVDTSNRARIASTNSFALFAASVESGAPPWLADSDDLVTSADDLPTDAIAAAEALGLDNDAAYAGIRHVWGKVDTAQRERIGEAGEAILIEILRRAVAAEITQVSSQSDGFGFDISVDAPSTTLHLEVKASVRVSRQSIYLSRHEFETMRRDDNWELVLISLDRKLEPVGLRSIDRAWVEQSAPLDKALGGRWESVRLDARNAPGAAGIQRLRSLVADPSSPLLTGNLLGAI